MPKDCVILIYIWSECRPENGDVLYFSMCSKIIFHRRLLPFCQKNLRLSAESRFRDLSYALLLNRNNYCPYVNMNTWDKTGQNPQPDRAVLVNKG